jgi:hypothetical protein
MKPNEPITIRDVYPQMSDEELSIAEANLKRYVAVIVRIYDRLQAEGKSWPLPDAPRNLTTLETHHTITDERSNSPNMRN